MKIVNKTHWQTKHLRAFLSRVAQNELSAEQRARTTVTFTYTRGSCGSSGFASYSSGHATVRLSKHTPDKIDLAFVLAHELAHTRGMHHRSMTGDPKYRRLPRTREIYGWAAGLPLEPQEQKTKKRPTNDHKLERARGMLKKHEIKLKRQTTIVRKWRLRVQYYERKGLQLAAICVPTQNV